MVWGGGGRKKWKYVVYASEDYFKITLNRWFIDQDDSLFILYQENYNLFLEV